jgi:hypothetical protein
MTAMRKQPKLQRLVAYATIFPKLRPLSRDIFDARPGAGCVAFFIILVPAWAISSMMAVAVVMASAPPMAVASGITLWPSRAPTTSSITEGNLKIYEPIFIPILGPANRRSFAEGAYCVRFTTDFSCVVVHDVESNTAVAFSNEAVVWLRSIVYSLGQLAAKKLARMSWMLCQTVRVRTTGDKFASKRCW